MQDKLTGHVEKLETILQQVVRVFPDEDTYCPSFQFLPDLSLHPVVTSLFNRTMALRIPHNYFTLWMMTPSPSLHGRRPVDRLGGDTADLIEADNRGVRVKAHQHVTFGDKTDGTRDQARTRHGFHH